MNHGTDSHWPDWMKDAACTSAGTEGFYPVSKEDDWVTPRRVCESCPVVLVCRDWVMALERGVGVQHRFGVIAGLTPRQRYKLEPQWLAEQPGAA